MSRRRPWRLVLIGVCALVVTLLVAVAVLTTTAVRRPLPDTSGDRDVSGLDGRVTVLRDERGVPSVYADTALDLFRAQGYVHAQDRFFEMDWRRHVTAGRLSELVGPNEDALLADKVVRTLGWRRGAAAELAQAEPSTRAYLDAYAEGVNEYISTRSPAQLSLQYSLLGLSVDLPRIEPWTPEDSVAWFKAMAWDLRGNYDSELARAEAFGAVKDVARVEQLFPAYPYAEHAPILAAADVRTGTPSAARPGTADPARPAAQDVTAALRGPDAARAVAAARRAVESVPEMLGGTDGTGSNSWVVSGRLSATGKPLLANDPHLSPSLPGVWYQAGLHCREVSVRCPFDVAGFTFAGVPGVVIGHTGTIAWGMTNLGPDVTDLYLERTRGDTVERDGDYVPMTVRTETIAVAGADPVQLTVRSTEHGPLLSDVLPSVADAGAAAPAGGSGYAVSLAWTALTPGHDMDAVFAVDTATDFASFRRAVLLMDVPAQNFVYADNLGDHGHVGYQAPGRIPLRATVRTKGTDGARTAPTDGTWPLPGWDSRYDWQGFVDTADLPWTLDPDAGFLVAANQAVTPRGTGVRFTSDFDYGWRSQRIRDLVTARTANGRLMTTSDMASIQLDTRNPLWERLEPVLLAADVDAFTAQGRALLHDWDGSQPVGSAAAAYFNAVWASLLELTFDELPEGSRPDGGGRWMQVVTALLERPRDPWWDDRSTPGVVETRDEIVLRSLQEARLRLTREQGKDPAGWTWGRAHTLRLAATPTGEVSATAPLHRLLNRGRTELPGGPAVVDALAYDASSGTFDVVSAPSMRMVVDLADVDRSRWVNQTGQSGHPGSAHYADQLEAWATGRTYPWPFGAVAVRQAAVDTLTLRPPD
ncbi:penicillin acylase family protein [Kineosporia sp. A_224]|uniref:penicillin acylase family protein n=1 Tax=Kineosporia sp. A_224 TaxID=1962180 RepID=UPI0018E943ED|nr:penicillin acylase family protein [Kineosporia sp. A_224]